MYNLSIIYDCKSVYRISYLENKSYDQIIEEMKDLFLDHLGGKTYLIDIGWREPDFVIKYRNFKDKYWKRIQIGKIFSSTSNVFEEFNEDNIDKIKKEYVDITCSPGYSMYKAFYTNKL